MQLNEKGYYFAVLVLGLFAAASYQKTVRDKYEAIPTTALYYTTGGVVQRGGRNGFILIAHRLLIRCRGKQPQYQDGKIIAFLIQLHIGGPLADQPAAINPLHQA